MGLCQVRAGLAGLTDLLMKEGVVLVLVVLGTRACTCVEQCCEKRNV